jgi:excisionase family DNA binding protein
MPISMRRYYSTAEVAQMLKLKQPNLQRLIREQKIPFPPIVRVGGIKFRLWTRSHVERVRKILAKRRATRRQKR